MAIEIFFGKMPPPSENAYNIVVCPSPESVQTKNLKDTFVQTLRISLKKCKRIAHDGQIYGQNSTF